MDENAAKAAFIRNLTAVMESKGLSQSALASMLGMSRQSVHTWMTGISYPTANTIEKLSRRLGVTANDLVSDDSGYASQPSTYMPRRAVTSHGSAHVPIRRAGMTHAGNPMDEDTIDDFVFIPAEVAAAHPAGFALRVEGDCMNKRIPEGYDVVVDPEKEPVNGSVVVVEVKGYQSVMRRWLKGSRTLVLAADSYSDHDDIVINWDEEPVSVVGVVVWAQSEINEN